MGRKALKDELKRLRGARGDALREAYESGFRDGLEASVPGCCMKPLGVHYKGRFNADGQPHGEGVMTWPNGRCYEGEVRDGKPHGWGLMKWADGKCDSGKFHNGAPLSAYRGRYEGEVNAAGEPDGYGVMTWPDGARYEGEVRDGQLHGQGVMMWADGEIHEGEFCEGAPVKA